MTSNAPIKDFTRKRPAVRFQIDEHIYEAKRAIGLAQAQTVSQLRDSAADGTVDHIKTFGDIFAVLLKAESAERFRAHLVDEDDPIDPAQLSEILPWLLEELGLRPTPLSSESSDGSGAAASGTTSTDGAPEEASTP